MPTDLAVAPERARRGTIGTVDDSTVGEGDASSGDRAEGLAATHDLVIVANRLPMERSDDGWRASPGGLVRALLGLQRERHGMWVGWTGVADDPAETFTHDGLDLSAVPLDDDEIRGYYESVSNGALWPLYHDAIRPSVYDADSWALYRRVNEAFAKR